EARRPAERDDQAEEGREREGDDRYPERDQHALAKGVEDDGIVAVVGDQPGEEERQENRRQQPVRNLPATRFHDRRMSAPETLVRACLCSRRTISGSACPSCRRPSST